ncbi:hypothetical protein BDF14DRAFT_490307 [Spinellus fusiger]|nr:hypothetical protein BDF14DRAFT_490307 [Spinellus fusiger]
MILAAWMIITLVRYLPWLPKSYQSLARQYTKTEVNKKYISYLPHSGFHNQIISLINALVLAKALNLTLIMPELNIGWANHWRLLLESCFYGYRCFEFPQKYGGFTQRLSLSLYAQ